MWSCVEGVCSWVPSSGVPDLSCAADVPDSPCSRLSATGAALAAAAAVLGGSWAALATARRVKAARVPPHIFAAWACAGVAVASLPFAWLVGPRCIGALPALSGVLFALSAVLIVGAVQLLGLAQAAGIWCGAAALSSYAAVALREGTAAAGAATTGAPRPWWEPAAGAACVLAGIAGAAASGRMQSGEEARVASGRRGGRSSVGSSRWRRWAPPGQRATEDSIREEGGEGDEGEGEGSGFAAAAAAAVADADADAAAAAEAGDAQGGALGAPLLGRRGGAAGDAARAAAFRRAHGGGLAGVGGALLGLVLLPLEFAPYECRGLPWLPGAAAGAAAAGPLLAWLMHLFTTRKADPRPPLSLQPAAAAAPGLAAGAVWAAATACTLLAAQSLGLAAALAAAQAGLLVAGLWGVLGAGELRFLLPQLVFWISGLAVVGGAALMAGLL
ncbi:hypothetical protein Rsub_12575 [Raphidocelis subcapitata]|uniref:EamA domain-containing protein n=1 Tax=Raphidocelis subcapitata TaxID=307507 RepID=A0A2V0PIK8_9CHLO|nr:hypothetical protein Rsub_12575 [Raphidocelis subcapitata]|eukprot:GBF99638.1 hypothetical protein Rsub_12575 [Raphidocelis subcapitata]